MELFLLLLGSGLLLYLAAERNAVVRHRKALRYVIHVNGTRGKSAVTRLIAAGLAEGGVKTFCKTTGTVPMTISPDGTETEIRRRGKANIKEQINMLKQAAETDAETLVIECMAVDPELQYICEHKILHADIGVITNVRVDHVAEMGDTTEEVCRALCCTIPENGTVFTADRDCFDQISEAAKTVGSSAVLADSYEVSESNGLFPENIALALAVCRAVGVNEETALAGMKKVKRDPYTAASYRLCSGAYFLNGMSANDPRSTALLLERFLSHTSIKVKKKIIVLNCRSDRGYRTRLMLDYMEKEHPDEVWLLGGGRQAAKRRLQQKNIHVQCYRYAEELPVEEQKTGTVLYAIGNIAHQGIALTERMRKEGIEYVW